MSRNAEVRPSDDARAPTSDEATSNASGAAVGRRSLTDDEDGGDEVAWESIGSNYDEGAQLAHLTAEGADASGGAARSADGADAERDEDEETDGEVDASLAPDSESGGTGGDDGDDADDDGDDADDDADDDDGGRQLRARAAGGPAAAPAGGSGNGDSATSEKWRDQIDARTEQWTIKKGQKQPKRKNAPYNRYNDKDVRANHKSKDKQKKKRQIDRAGVRFQGEDIFTPIKDQAPRYRIIDGNRATSDGVLSARSKGKDRLAINPVHTRDLVDDATNAPLGPCVLTWHGGRRAAWLPVSQLKLKSKKGNKNLKQHQKNIQNTVNKRANQWQPKPAPPAALKDAAHFTFGGSGAQPTPFDEKHYVVPRQRSKGANQVADYLRKKDGVTYNIMVNLPHERLAPVAADITVEGDHFFIPKTGGVIQTISIYKRGKNQNRVIARQTWVFGHVGVKDASGPDVDPDPKRRGWVPLRVLDPVK